MTEAPGSPTWLFVGMRHPSAARDLGEVALGSFVLQRVERGDPALAGLLDERWAVTELYVLREATPGTAWERRLARELAPVFADDVGTAAREVTLSGVPATAPSAYTPPQSLAEPEAFAAWLEGVRGEDGRIADAAIVARLTADHGLDDEIEDGPPFEIAVGRARAKPEGLTALAEAVRTHLRAELPTDYVAFLRDVGALRLETIDEGERSSLGDVFLPAKAVIEALHDDVIETLRETEGTALLPFFRYADRRYFALDLGCEPPVVVRISEEPEEVTHASFAHWLAAWRAESLSARAIASHRLAAIPPGLTNARTLQQWWSTNEAWVRPMYEKPG